MEALIALVVILLLFKFGGSILEGMFDSVGVVGKIIGFVLGVVVAIYFLMSGCA